MVRVSSEQNQPIMRAGRKCARGLARWGAGDGRNRPEKETVPTDSAAAPLPDQPRPQVCRATLLVFSAYRHSPIVKRVAAMTDPTPNPPLAAHHPATLPETIFPPTGAAAEAAAAAADEAITWSPSARSTASWAVYDLGDTVFQMAMITTFFPLWVKAVGGRESHIAS